MLHLAIRYYCSKEEDNKCALTARRRGAESNVQHTSVCLPRTQTIDPCTTLKAASPRTRCRIKTGNTVDGGGYVRLWITRDGYPLHEPQGRVPGDT